MGMRKECILNFSDCIWIYVLLPVKHNMIHWDEFTGELKSTQENYSWYYLSTPAFVT